MGTLREALRAYREAIDAAGTPGEAAHDAWCADHEWDELDSEQRGLWEDAAWAAIDFYLSADSSDGADQQAPPGNATTSKED